MKLHGRTPKVRPQPPPSAKVQPPPPALMPTDKEALQRSIERLRDAHETMDPFGFLTSEGTQLLCASPSDAYDRLTTFLSNISIVSGLILSSIAGTALEPIDVDEFAGGKRTLADAFNVIAAVTVIVQLMVVLFSTYTLYLVSASVHTPTAAYRATLHMTRWLGFLEFCSYLPALGVLGLIIIAAQLRCGDVAAWTVLVVTPILWLGFQACFDCMCCRAMPYSAWRWSAVTSFGIPWLSKRLRTDAKVQGALLLDQAKDGVLGGLDEDNDCRIDEVVDVAAAELELGSWLEGVLSVAPTSASLLAQRLFAAGLTHSRMIEAAACPGGFTSLCDMLAATGKVGMRPGDALALASAAMRDSQKRSATRD